MFKNVGKTVLFTCLSLMLLTACGQKSKLKLAIAAANKQCPMDISPEAPISMGGLFGFQLLFNFTWSIFFFYLRSPLLGFANILVLDVLVVYYMIESYPVKKSSAYLFVPYLLWLILATYLNGYILMYN